MKIIPTTGKDGHYYFVVEDSWWTRKYLTEIGLIDHHIELCLNPPLKFKTVKAAVKEIRRLYGECAKIERWEG